MNEINIAKQLLESRHKKKITQEELASYIGVSKAAVSKWESGNTFPDITLLPKLAAYFNMSIDELIGYSPQLTKEEIREKYHELKEHFTARPFDEAMNVCAEYEQKYYSCFPFLLQMVILYMNHGMLSDDPKRCYDHAAALAKRIQEQSEDMYDAKEAATLEAAIYMMAGEPMRALDLMDQHVRPMPQDTELLAQIYQQTGDADKAKTTYQIAIYQHLLALANDLVPLMVLYAQDITHCDEIIKRALSMIDLYNLEPLHPNTAALIYLAIAQVYCANGRNDSALDMLQKYVRLCKKHFFPYSLHGDDFFDRIDSWFLHFDLGSEAPRSEELIRQSIVQSVQNNPAYAPLHDDPRYIRLLETLKANCTTC